MGAFLETESPSFISEAPRVAHRGTHGWEKYPFTSGSTACRARPFPPVFYLRLRICTSAYLIFLPALSLHLDLSPSAGKPCLARPHSPASRCVSAHWTYAKPHLTSFMILTLPEPQTGLGIPTAPTSPGEVQGWPLGLLILPVSGQCNSTTGGCWNDRFCSKPGAGLIFLHMGLKMAFLCCWRSLYA